MRPAFVTYSLLVLAQGALLLLIPACSEAPTGRNAAVPVVTTTPAHTITRNSAIAGGTVVADGGEAVTARGLRWKSALQGSGWAETSDNGTGTGPFSTLLTGLAPGTKHYVQAWAVNRTGRGWGVVDSFRTQSDSTGGVSDVDGNYYSTVWIGEQQWMQENLRVTHYRNGDPVVRISDSTHWVSTGAGAWCSYGLNDGFIGEYGRLYNAFAALDQRNIAPSGWHVPSDAEWQQAVDYLGGSAIAGGKMMESGYHHWAIPNLEGTNASGFTALPGGYREGSTGSFHGIFTRAAFWSRTPAAAGGYGCWILMQGHKEIVLGHTLVRDACSIRCVKD
ncbi:MAG TPA: fibrobacter succinogenes major paralogous domain-containing protein [bacterium]|nr:fibrobacter succinogenes major paralogous domain-containing protein [bacterium]HPR89222.1 fibrobacter succinogenes major paralogous domain-containing protein [bacterium]